MHWEGSNDIKCYRLNTKKRVFLSRLVEKTKLYTYPLTKNPQTVNKDEYLYQYVLDNQKINVHSLIFIEVNS